MEYKKFENPLKPAQNGFDPNGLDPNGLKPTQERALAAMLEARSIAAAARRAEVGESTLRRWLREDEHFQTALRQMREEALSHASLRLQEGASRAVERLLTLMESEEKIEPGRVTLVRTALDFAFRAGAYTTLADRVAALENVTETNAHEH